MQVTWLGQAGVLLVHQGIRIMIDPYMSNSLEEENGVGYQRMVPIQTEFLVAPDVLVITHIHEDHMDLQTIDQLLKGSVVTVMAPLGVIRVLRERKYENIAYVMLVPEVEVTILGIEFRGMPAVHSDLEAVGIEIFANGVCIYHMGDTLYHPDMIRAQNKPVDCLLIPINGKGNNMNEVDAARMTKAISPKRVYPIHWDMFENYKGNVEVFKKLMADSEIVVIQEPAYNTFDL
ncbi:MBL fold metallo-hydrolase [Chakrabartyella piscis]|uniref:MBL fold metallo-hydrolase n=1 Tax=Chakrabartyella piscis TaxID=2918914 RepID=UPI002958A75C|nr:MBL fold metallo-hydrolase [Chakrabartyella piscis]